MKNLLLSAVVALLFSACEVGSSIKHKTIEELASGKTYMDGYKNDREYCKAWHTNDPYGQEQCMKNLKRNRS